MCEDVLWWWNWIVGCNQIGLKWNQPPSMVEDSTWFRGYLFFSLVDLFLCIFLIVVVVVVNFIKHHIYVCLKQTIKFLPRCSYWILMWFDLSIFHLFKVISFIERTSKLDFFFHFHGRFIGVYIYTNLFVLLTLKMNCSSRQWIKMYLVILSHIILLDLILFFLCFQKQFCFFWLFI